MATEKKNIESKLPNPHRQVRFAESPTPCHKRHMANLPSPLHPVDWGHKFCASQTLQRFTGCQMSENYSFSAQESAQKIRLPSKYFFTGCLIQKRVQTFFFKNYSNGFVNSERSPFKLAFRAFLRTGFWEQFKHLELKFCDFCVPKLKEWCGS